MRTSDKLLLCRAVRQYRHNDSDEFLIGYDAAETEKIVDDLQAQLKQRDETIEAINLKFISGNRIPVERVTITAKEWQALNPQSSDKEV